MSDPREPARRRAIEEFEAINGPMPAKTDRDARVDWQKRLHAFLVARELIDP